MMVSTQIANDPKAPKAYLKDQYYPSPKIKKCTHIYTHANYRETRGGGGEKQGKTGREGSPA